MVIDKRLDIFPVPEPFPLLRRRQVFAAVVAPAPFEDKRIPDLDLFLVRPMAALETPFQNLFVRSALQRLLDQLVVIDPQKSRSAGIENGGIRLQAGEISRRQLAGRLEPDLIQHPGEIDEAFGLLVISNWRLHVEEVDS